MGILEVNVGLAADIGTLQRLPKIVGNDSIVRELALTGRMFGPEEAASMGFASKVVQGARLDVIKEALQVAKTIASKSPVAVAGTKRMLLRECEPCFDRRTFANPLSRHPGSLGRRRAGDGRGLEQVGPVTRTKVHWLISPTLSSARCSNQKWVPELSQERHC